MNDYVLIVQELLGPLDTLLKRGEVAYQNYISHERKFLYAKIIRENNIRIRELILEKSHLLPLDQHLDAIKLVTHIDVWSALWDDLNERKKHSLEEEFVFDNYATFPKKSVDSILSFYKDIKNTPDSKK